MGVIEEIKGRLIYGVLVYIVRIKLSVPQVLQFL